MGFELGRARQREHAGARRLGLSAHLLLGRELEPRRRHAARRLDDRRLDHGAGQAQLLG